MCNRGVPKFSFIIRYFLDQCRTQKICDKAILENGGPLESVPNWYKTKEMCDKVVDNYLHALEFVPDY